MTVLVDTILRSTVDKTLLRAFLYGVVHGEYKLYKDLSNSRLSVKFEDGADATVFKIKELDLQFNRNFAEDDDSTECEDDSFAQMPKPNFSGILDQMRSHNYKKRKI